MMLICKSCGFEMDSSMFKTSIVNGKVYYRKNACRICLGMKPKKQVVYRSSLNSRLRANRKEAMYTITKIYFNKGLADMVDCYRLAGVYSDIFGVGGDDYADPLDDLRRMYNKLLDVYEKKGIFRYRCTDVSSNQREDVLF